MKRDFPRFILIPRIIMIAYILFLMLFSFDVFNLEGDVLEKIGGFIIHSAPSIAMAVLLGIFWNRPAISGWVFIGAFVLLTLFFGTYEQMESFLVISVPPLVSGVLFLAAAQTARRGEKDPK
jgi:hypothetical protein